MAKRKNRRHETTRFPVPNGRPSDPKSPKVTPKPLRFPLREEGGIAKWKCMSLTVVYQRFRERTFALLGGGGERTDTRTRGHADRDLCRAGPAGGGPGNEARGRWAEAKRKVSRSRAANPPLHSNTHPPRVL